MAVFFELIDRVSKRWHTKPQLFGGDLYSPPMSLKASWCQGTVMSAVNAKSTIRAWARMEVCFSIPRAKVAWFFQSTALELFDSLKWSFLWCLDRCSIKSDSTSMSLPLKIQPIFDQPTILMVKINFTSPWHSGWSPEWSPLWRHRSHSWGWRPTSLHLAVSQRNSWSTCWSPSLCSSAAPGKKVSELEHRDTAWNLKNHMSSQFFCQTIFTWQNSHAIFKRQKKLLFGHFRIRRIAGRGARNEAGRVDEIFEVSTSGAPTWKPSI